jgi:TetR/AcrR family transcriptional regulator, transcriptional repressor for nem operon
VARYSKQHKVRTREDILRAAARMFRARGYNGVGIEAIMRELGLTRGGFYNHFKSKQDLFTQVLRWDKDFVARMQARTDDGLARQGIKIAMDYLEPKHRTAVGPNCVLTTLTPDAVRAGHEASKALTETVQSLVREFERGLDNPKQDDERALVAVALCVGGLLLARAADGTRLANRISRACQKAVADVLTS